MRVHFSTGWIFQGWITCLIFALCVQRNQTKPTCSLHQYPKNNKCCDKCQPGTYLFASCTENKQTICRPCGTDEYQSEYNTKTKCLPQKFCDDGKGFYRVAPSSRTQPEPCQCKEGYQCSRMNCEFCERIPSCIAGQGLMGDPGKQMCKECEPGFYSDSNSSEPCKKWTDCKATGKTEEKPGTLKKDVECGPPFGPSSTSWVLVLIACAVIVLLAAVLACYKDKLILFPVNLRTCVQNIKRSRIQQETLTPPYHSTGLQNGLLYDITSHRILQDDSHPEYRMCSETKLTASGPALTQSHEQVHSSAGSGRERADGSSSSSSSDGSEGSPTSPLSGSSCSCLPSMKEPVEVGENEDCSQLVAPSPAEHCSCSQRQTLEATGQGTGNDSTSTSVSNRQVTNFTGDVIMAYVRQTSLNNGNMEEDPCGCSVLEGSCEGRCQPAMKHPAPPLEGGTQQPGQEMANLQLQHTLSV